MHPDWEQLIAGFVASFRTSIGTEVDDPRIAQPVGELSLAGEPFRRLWARHDVRALAGASVRMLYQRVGMLKLRREKLPAGGTGGQVLAIYHAEPHSDSARALALLGSLADAGSAGSRPGALSGERPQTSTP